MGFDSYPSVFWLCAFVAFGYYLAGAESMGWRRSGTLYLLLSLLVSGGLIYAMKAIWFVPLVAVLVSLVFMPITRFFKPQFGSPWRPVLGISTLASKWISPAFVIAALYCFFK